MWGGSPLVVCWAVKDDIKIEKVIGLGVCCLNESERAKLGS